MLSVAAAVTEADHFVHHAIHNIQVGVWLAIATLLCLWCIEHKIWRQQEVP